MEEMDESPDRTLTTRYVLVVLLEAAIIVLLVAFGRAFSLPTP